MIKTRLARRYARAMFELAKEAGQIEEYGRDLALVDSLFNTDSRVRMGLTSQALSRAVKDEVVEALISATGVSKTVGNFIRVLNEARKVFLLPHVYAEYSEMADKATGKLRGTAIAPMALSADEVARLAAALTKALGKEVILEAKTDPSLLGGVVAKVGNMVYDGSVKTQLQRMKESLIKG